MAQNMPEEGPSEQQYEWTASIPTERSPASADDLPPAEISVSFAVQDSEVSSSGGRHSHETNEGTASENSFPSSENDVAASLTEFEGVAAAVIARMEPVRPDIIQAVPAYEVKRFGRVFRARRRASSHHSRVSFRTTKIDQFWSRSWHGPKWNKVLTAVYLNNGMVAALARFLASFVLMFLHAYRFLPALRFRERLYPISSWWISVTCIVLYCIVMFPWRPKQKIFLHVLCIDQRLQKQGTRACEHGCVSPGLRFFGRLLGSVMEPSPLVCLRIGRILT